MDRVIPDINANIVIFEKVYLAITGKVISIAVAPKGA